VSFIGGAIVALQQLITEYINAGTSSILAFYPESSNNTEIIYFVIPCIT
jgi:hypothetical protein